VDNSAVTKSEKYYMTLAAYRSRVKAHFLFKTFAHKRQSKQYETTNEPESKAPKMNTNSCPLKKKRKANNKM